MVFECTFGSAAQAKLGSGLNSMPTETFVTLLPWIVASDVNKLMPNGLLKILFDVTETPSAPAPIPSPVVFIIVLPKMDPTAPARAAVPYATPATKLPVIVVVAPEPASIPPMKGLLGFVTVTTFALMVAVSSDRPELVSV